jgi:subfamily B ATP-binding cassette protein MsbA
MWPAWWYLDAAPKVTCPRIRLKPSPPSPDHPALSFVGSTVRFFQEYLSDKASISAVTDIRRHLYDHILHTPLSFFGTQGTSDVTSRLVGDSQQLQDGFKIILGQSVQEPIRALFFFGLAIALSWRLTLLIVVFAPLMGWAIKKFGKKMRRASRARCNAPATCSADRGTLIGIRVVRCRRCRTLRTPPLRREIMNRLKLSSSRCALRSLARRPWKPSA